MGKIGDTFFFRVPHHGHSNSERYPQALFKLIFPIIKAPFFTVQDRVYSSSLGLTKFLGRCWAQCFRTLPAAASEALWNGLRIRYYTWYTIICHSIPTAGALRRFVSPERPQLSTQNRHIYVSMRLGAIYLSIYLAANLAIYVSIHLRVYNTVWL